MNDQQVFKTPTQPLDLPSKGLLYPETSPLSSGIVDLYLPTALHEDILTNRNYIQQGVVLDKFLQSIIASKVNYDELLVGDKNAILVGARILAYGSKYTFKYIDPVTKVQEDVTVDLADLKDKEVDWSLFTKGVNEFDFLLPMSKATITFKLLSHKDENNIEGELKGLQKINKNVTSDITVRLYHTIVAVNGNRDQKQIRDFVKAMPMRDSQELRKYMSTISPDIDMKFDFVRGNGEVVEGLTLPMTVDFFWPEL
jgi:hypothetical protein